MGLIHSPYAAILWDLIQGQLPAYTGELIAEFRILIIVAGLVVGFLIGLTGVGGGVLLMGLGLLASVSSATLVGAAVRAVPARQDRHPP